MTDTEEKLKCPHCDLDDGLDGWEVGGMCDSQVLCPKCFTIVSTDTKQEAEPCGYCEFCELTNYAITG